MIGLKPTSLWHRFFWHSWGACERCFSVIRLLGCVSAGLVTDALSHRVFSHNNQVLGVLLSDYAVHVDWSTASRCSYLMSDITYNMYSDQSWYDCSDWSKLTWHKIYHVITYNCGRLIKGLKFSLLMTLSLAMPQILMMVVSITLSWMGSADCTRTHKALAN